MLISINEIINDYGLNIKGIIHIGAHHGQEYTSYIKGGIINIMFFEPATANFKILKDRVNKGVKLFNLALGNETGEREMYIETANEGMSNSMLKPGTHLIHYPHITFDKRETVKIDKLDNINFDRQLYNMINIDVQGFELEVFRGAIESLKYIDIIYTEVNTEEVYKGCPLISDIDTFLGKMCFHRIAESFKYSPAWGDAIYIR